MSEPVKETVPLEDAGGGRKEPQALVRDVGLLGAVLLGLGSIVGTGVFVSIGITAGVTGPSVLLAVFVASIVATCNALSSANLAANLPTSGGTYEYGYRLLHPLVGFMAGWLFLCAKTASAATAALGFGGYSLRLAGEESTVGRVLIAVGIVVLLTGVVLLGIKRSNTMNLVLVFLTCGSLVVFIGVASADASNANFAPFFRRADEGAGKAVLDVLQACALMFVAFTGYGRVATLGEEVHNPRKTIPRAIVVTLVVSASLYAGVAAAAVAAVGSEALGTAAEDTAAPLEFAARAAGGRTAGIVVAVGGLLAMQGVLLNLILGLSRVVLAMGRRGDLPRALASLNAARTTPYWAVVVVGVAIAALSAVGNVKSTWSFSAFTVLCYYAICNAAAIRLPRDKRIYSPVWSWVGIVGCLFLAVWIEWIILLVGIGVLLVGVVYRTIFHHFVPPPDPTDTVPGQNVQPTSASTAATTVEAEMVTLTEGTPHQPEVI